ncbi:MAG: transporter [Rhodococcus erythropolis]|nr:MFS transporter [Rhodococcus erythropolis]MDF2896725.1 transporter [Rhodococcus erythropolis]
MTTNASDRVPLTFSRGAPVFSIGVIGFITANLTPLMIIAMVDDLGATESTAGAVLTASLLVCAITCLATTGIASGRHRHLLGRISLIELALSFGVAALAPSPVIAYAAIILGGIGAGGAAAVGGAALAAFANPNRASSVNGLVNRLLVTGVLALVPILGTHMTNVFGVVAVLALAIAATLTWMPSAPVNDALDTVKRPRLSHTSISDKKLTLAGTAFLAMVAVWAVSEDSFWAVLGIMGSDRADLSDQQLALALSLSTAAGIAAAIVLAALGSRLNRTVSISVLLALGGIVKLATCLTTDATVYMILVIAWNTIYATAVMVFQSIAAALDSTGRWAAPFTGTYLIGSAFAPLFGTTVSAGLGYPIFGIIISGVSFALLVPFVLIARLSTRTEGAHRHNSAVIPSTVVA